MLSPLHYRGFASRKDDDDVYPAAISEALRDLPHPAFAAWIALHILDADQLALGCGSIARAIGVPARTLNRRLHQLEEAEYVELASRGKGSRIRIRMLRRPLMQ